MLVAGARAGLGVVYPDHPFETILIEAEPWLQTGIMALAGYMTRNRA
jgi:hypothetical protein